MARSLSAVAAFVVSWQTARSTRELEQRREHGDNSVKDAVALTPQSRVFKVPNALVAECYFGAAFVLSITGLADNRLVRRPFLVSSWGALGLSAYLIAQLVFVLKQSCPLCMRAHALNFAFALTTTASFLSSARRGR